MRKLLVAGAGAGICAVLIALALLVLVGHSPFAQAGGGSGLDPNIVGVDMNPYNGPPVGGNTKSDLGPIDRCVTVTTSTFDIDVFLDDVPFSAGAYHNLGGYEYRLLYDNSKLAVPGPVINHAGVMTQVGGASDMGDCSAMGAPCPDVDGAMFTSEIGLGGEASAEGPGSHGFTDRYTMQVVGGIGTYTFLQLVDLAYGGYEPGVTPWTDQIDQVWDALNSPVYGIVALNVPCPTSADLSITSFAPLPLPPATIPVSEQPVETFKKVIHNAGAQVPALTTTTVDIPNNVDTGNFPMCQVSYLCESLGEQITVKAGVVWGWKDLVAGICVPAGTGPGVVACIPGLTFCANAVQGLPDEVQVKYSTVLPPGDTTLTEYFDKHCYEASFHDYLFNAYVEPADIWGPMHPFWNPGEPVPNGTNLAGDPDYENNDALYLEHTGFTAQADLEVVSQLLNPYGATPVTWLDMDKDNKVDLPYIQAGTTQKLDVIKVVHNNGPSYSPVDAKLTKSAIAMRMPVLAPESITGGQCGGPPYTGNGIDEDTDGRKDDGCMMPCTVSIAPLTGEELALTNVDRTHIGETVTLTCTMANVGIQADDDGDTRIDEDRLGGGGADSDKDAGLCKEIDGTRPATAATNCANGVDEDGDNNVDLGGWVNDGCPAVGTPEPSSSCNEAAGYGRDDDGDTVINDGCAKKGLYDDCDANHDLDCADAGENLLCSNAKDDDIDLPDAHCVSCAVDEDACEVPAVDNDADTLINEDDPLGNDDCDWQVSGVLPLIDEDSAIVPVVVAVTNTIAPKDTSGHITDPTTINNSLMSTFTFIVARDLTPAWSVSMSDFEANVLTNPVGNNCIQFAPCKKVFSMAIPVDQPFVGQITITPGSFTECHGKLGCDMAPSTADDPINGQIAGQITFTAHADISVSHSCVDLVGGQATLYEAALSAAAGEGPDTLGNLVATASYPPELDRDPLIRSVRAMGAQEWLRRVGRISALNMPVNNIVFNAGTSWLSVTVLGDPLNPSPINTCTAMTADTIMLGAAGGDINQVYEKCTTQSSQPDDKIFVNKMIRIDNPNFAIVNMDTATCTAPASDITVGLCKDEDIGDTHNFQCSVPLVDQLIPASLPRTFPVEVTVNPGAASQKVKVSLSVVSHDPCTAEWIAAVSPSAGVTNITPYTLTEVGSTNVDRLDFTTPIINTPTVYTGSYSIHCTTPGYYPQNIQVTASVTTANVPPISDPDTSNNTAENRVDVTVSNIPDVDYDTIPNGSDNCPWVWNPDQLNSDGDSMGDACDEDDDNDGILDGPDVCETAAEDFDGSQDTDGCPDSDVTGLVVTRVEPVAVDVSQNKVEPVTATAQNGNYLSNIDFTLLLVSVVSNPADKCEARWVCLPGDNCVEDIIDGKLFSQLEVTKANVAPEAFASVTRSYTVHCNAPSYHSVILEVSALPAPPVIDPNVQNGNVWKDLSLEITATALADLKKVGISVFADDCHDPPPTVLEPGVAQQICIAQTYHNNGPYGPVQAYDVLTINGPADCTANGNALPWSYDANPSLPVSVDVVQDRTVTIVCALPSSHSFTLSDVLTVNQLHVRDPNAANNTKSVPWNVAVIDTDAAVTLGVNVAAPTDAYVSEDELFNVTKIFTYSGGVSGTTVEPKVEQVMKPTGNNAADCQVSFHVTNALLAKVKDLVITKDGVVVNPPTPYGWEASDVVWGAFGGSLGVRYQIPLAGGGSPPPATALVEEWDKHCVAPSYHSFSLTTDLSRDPAKDPHILYTVPTQNVQTWTEEIWAEADIGIVDWFFMDIPLVDTDGSTTVDTPLVKVAPSSWKYGHEKEVIHNNGPYGPVDVKTVVLADADPICGISYNVIGNETQILVDGVDKTQSAPGTDLKSLTGGYIQVTLDAQDIAVSVDLWQALLWNFHISDQTECTVYFTKDITSELHVLEPEQDAKPNHMEKDVIVCADTDGDTVADNCPTLDQEDNCKHDANPDQKDSDGDGEGDACDDQPKHDVGTKSCLVFGPAPANLGDTTGRYMWVICEVGNFSGHPEQVSIDLTVEAPPTGCTSSESLILPGFENFWMPTAEQKWVLYRVKYVCLTATTGVYPLDISMCIKHDTVHADGGQELGAFLLNNCWNGVRNLIVHNNGP